MNATPAAPPPSSWRGWRTSPPTSSRQPSPVARWDRYGLRSRCAWKPFAAASRYDSLPRPERFRLALEETGGLFEIFGRFLLGRADLLPSPYLTQLQAVRSSRKPHHAPATVAELRNRISDAALIGFSPVAEIYSGTFQDRPVLLEIYPEKNFYPDSSNREWRDFERQIKLLGDAPELAVAQPTVLEQFREWMNWQADIQRKRSILRNLSSIPFETATRFPRLIEELQADRFLAYEKQDGEPLADLLRPGAQGLQVSSALDLWTESQLEQALILSLIDSEARPENYLLLRGGGIGFRAIPSFVTVPVEWHSELVQYTASAAAGNSQRAIQMLSRICAAESAYEAEHRILERLSALQPELKIQQFIPATVVNTENYWRALRQVPVESPLFLHLYHRNLTVMGTWASMCASSKAGPASSENPEQAHAHGATGSAAPASPQPTARTQQNTDLSASEDDVVAGSLWPVLGRLLQYRAGELVSSEKGIEWLYSSALLIMSGARQVAITIEQIRDNDVALLLEGSEEETMEQARSGRTASAIGCALALGMLMISAEIARQTGGVLSAVATAAAIVSAATLCVLIAGIK